MIEHGLTWQKELLKLSKRIEKKKESKKDWSFKNYIDFEKEIMFGFYIIRKLIDGKKLTNKIISTNLKGIKFQNNGNLVTIRNKHRFHEFYDYNNPIKEKFDLKFLINQFIHSYIFYPVLAIKHRNNLKFYNNTKNKVSDDEFQNYFENSKKEMISILFSSDDKKNKFIYEIEIIAIIKLFNSVGNCVINSISYSYNDKKKDYDIDSKYDEYGEQDLPF